MSVNQWFPRPCQFVATYHAPHGATHHSKRRRRARRWWRFSNLRGGEGVMKDRDFTGKIWQHAALPRAQPATLFCFFGGWESKLNWVCTGKSIYSWRWFYGHVWLPECHESWPSKMGNIPVVIWKNRDIIELLLYLFPHRTCQVRVFRYWQKVQLLPPPSFRCSPTPWLPSFRWCARNYVRIVCQVGDRSKTILPLLENRGITSYYIQWGLDEDLPRTDWENLFFWLRPPLLGLGYDTTSCIKIQGTVYPWGYCH